MTLPGNITDTIATIDALCASINNEINRLSDFFSEATSGAISMCSTISIIDCLQLYHNRDVCDSATAYEIVKSMADDAYTEIRWEEDTAICFYFKIDRRDFCIVLDK